MVKYEACMKNFITVQVLTAQQELQIQRPSSGSETPNAGRQCQCTDSSEHCRIGRRAH